MRISPNKLKAIILYFSLNTEYLGKVKLMKLIYFLDFSHIKKYGRPVTFDKYVHLGKGPIPSNIMDLVADAEENLSSSVLSDTIKIQLIDTRRNKMIKFTPVRDFTDEDAELFSETELDTLKEVAKKFKNTRTDEIVDASHKEAAWQDTDYLDEIPYTLAARDKDSEVDREDIQLLLKSL